jgi:hypothetical protein
MKRSSYLHIKSDTYVPLGKSGFSVMGYGKKQQFVCRLYVNGAGVEVYAGKNGRRKIADLGWETLVDWLKSR